MATWWVNHKQSYKAEREGGFIWSPKIQADGSFSQFYKNMTLVEAGDTIISYANGKISDIGIATSTAISTAIPRTHRKAGNDWDHGDGWTIAISWMELSQPIILQEILVELVPFLPEKHAPFRANTGHGNAGAYFSSMKNGAQYALLAAVGPTERKRFAQHVESIVIGDPEQAVEDTIENAILGDPDLDATTRKNLVKSRIGQGLFKDRLKEIETCCRLTGMANESLLIASHILAWKSCTTSQQRLDGHNGLLLTPNADRLFDRGHISFKNDGRVLVKDAVSDEDLGRLGLAGLRKRNVGSFTAQQQTYLEFHRNLNGFSESS